MLPSTGSGVWVKFTFYLFFLWDFFLFILDLSTVLPLFSSIFASSSLSPFFILNTQIVDYLKRLIVTFDNRVLRLDNLWNATLQISNVVHFSTGDLFTANNTQDSLGRFDNHVQSLFRPLSGLLGTRHSITCCHLSFHPLHLLYCLVSLTET